jgi:hypothetical protein
MIWEQTSPDASFTISYSVNQLLPGCSYLIYGDGALLRKGKSNTKGNFIFTEGSKHQKIKIVLDDSVR